MRSRRFNAIREMDAVLPAIEAVLLPLGFVRADNVFHRRSDADVLPRVEAVTLGLAYGFRTCWLHVTVKVPALIELLSAVRPFAYSKALAWQVPDYASHVACMLRLSELGAAGAAPLPDGIRWREDGRLQRARRVTAETLGATMASLVEHYALPALRDRLTLRGLAAAADTPGYERSGVAGAWPLAARLALGDVAGAERAFRAHPYSLGSDRARVATAKAWLKGCGVAVGDVAWSQEAADVGDPWDARAWLTGELLP
ncbi:hypothetical protein SAMN05216359_101502 [Roseateles sp. YR242]|uniref:hypothetical protein n=1 Tax=Roseateles sp. YR242 TaxID=1855305 RepID=UPI0008C28FC1|nr:hypothetical protein [Roseateles sp. YR242]SEK34517.1 hypothetical protein SAMN05216359_101502 [Roseateles sp. YR242]